MSRYYTRVCNFYYGSKSKTLIKEKKTLPLNGNNEISFDKVEIISRNSKKTLSIKKIDNLPKNLIISGDWTQNNLPCTIEGSIVSGKKAVEFLR